MALMSENERLVAGVGLWNGVLLMTERRMALGYRAPGGEIRSLLRPLPGFLRLLGPWVGLLAPLLAFWALWLVGWDRRASQDERREMQSVRWGFAAGFIPSLFLIQHAPSWLVPSLLLLLGGSVLLHPQLRREAWRGIQEWRRYHGAEHQVVHAVLREEEVSEASVERQAVLSPYCGTNLFVWVLPLIAASSWLTIPALLPAVFLMEWAAKQQETSRLARALLAVGALGQRLTVAPSEPHHRAAAIAAWEALGLEQPGGGAAVPTRP